MTNNDKQQDILDKETISQIKEELLKRKESVEEELRDLLGSQDKEDGRKVKFPDFGDKSDENAQEIGEYSTNLATEKVLRSSLRDIDNALERIKKNTYGICKYCHEPIGKKRLLARPVASACVKCKTKLQNSL